MKRFPSSLVSRPVSRAVLTVFGLLALTLALPQQAAADSRSGAAQESGKTDEPAEISAPASLKELIAKGHYLAILGDCAACHSAPGRPPYSGGGKFTLPIGTIYATNITPDRKYGIGNYTEADFARAVRQGILPDGRTLYPAMPYPSYARLSDRDIHALYAYFHDGVAPAAIPSPRNGTIWPLSMRWPLVIWRWLFAPSLRSAQLNTSDEFTDPVLARGAYLVEGLGHCGACHTPRSFTMAEQALTGHHNKAYLAGGQSIDGWFAPSLRGENRTGLGRWSESDIVAFLKTGRAPEGAVFGAMTPVVVHSTSLTTDADLHAMARFLKQLRPARVETPWVYDPAATIALKHADVSQRGASVYVNRCAACHGTNGLGYGTPGTTAFPPLAGNPVLMTRTPESVVHIIQAGDALAPVPAAPSAFDMPPFVHKLPADQIADVASFIRKAWGNDAPPVSTKTVRKLRRSMPPPIPPADLPRN
ncbi:c-type cytochrome [Oecophyllibacter saccharovorans]|uniref:c-type cytochrome n=1 Tax=Oecophyllibacter saccharovorans TaxID=2558360 RepID=UPI00116BD263|nr:cytochrome c [Oecophyllibacter saccharovorans]TPW36282.1 c-type cytochrome [Oecophyllibacter saccharovorans]